MKTIEIVLHKNSWSSETFSIPIDNLEKLCVALGLDYTAVALDPKGFKGVIAQELYMLEIEDILNSGIEYNRQIRDEDTSVDIDVRFK